MKSNPVGWFEIYVQDMERAKDFYEKMLNTRLEKLKSPEIEMWAFPMEPGMQGSPGSLVKMPGVKSGGNSVLVYFSCLDCAEEAARAEKLGGKIYRAKTSIGEYGFIVLAYDSEGNLIGLHSQK